jgi:hypothetical protein
MIAFLKFWIFLIIIFQNHFFMKYIDYSFQNYESITKIKLFLTIFSITLLFLAAITETTYQATIKFGFLLIFSPIIFLVHLIGEK